MRRVLLTAALLVVGGVLVTGFAAAFRKEDPAYRNLPVTRGDIEVVVSATGKVRAKESVDVGAQVSGQLEVIHVEVGDRVQAGDLLAEIDPTIAQAKVDQGRAQLKELKASLVEMQASRDLARAEAARAELLRSADAISEAEYQIAVAQEKITAARIAQLEAQIERQESTLAADLANLAYTKILAPISGTVVAEVAVEGQTLNANQTTPTVLTIADLSVMTVEAEISEADVLRIEPGQPARFKLLGSDREWETVVRQVLPKPEVVNDVVLYKALMDVDNPDGMLRPEMTAQVFFSQGKAEDAVLIPVAALQDAGAGRTGPGRPSSTPPAELREAMQRHPDAQSAKVLVKEGDRVVPRPILIGLRNRVHAEVLYGLQPGDALVVPEITDSGSPSRGPRGPFGIGRR